MTLFSRTRVRRWAIVGLVLMAAAVLGDVAVLDSGRTPELGVELARQNDSLVVTYVEPAGLAWTDAMTVGDQVVLVNNAPAAAFNGTDQVTSLTAISASGEVVATQVPAPASGFVVPGFLAAAALFLLVGSVVYIVAAEWVPATIVLGLTVSSALLFLAPIAGLVGRPWANEVTFLALIGFGTTLFLLAHVLPVDRLKTRAGRRGAWVSLGLATVLLALYGWSIVSGAPYRPVRAVAMIVVGVLLLGAAAIVAVGVLRSSPVRHGSRRAAIQLGLGAAGGLIPFVILSLLPAALNLGYLIPPELSILSVVLVPVAIGGALLSRDFPGVERLVNRGLVALLVWGGLFAAYASAVHAAVNLPLTRDSSPDLVLVIGLALSLATFPLVQAWLRRVIERMLFRDLYDPADLVRQIGDVLVRLHGLATVSDHALGRIGAALDLRWAALMLDGDPTSAGPRVWGDAPADLQPTLSLQLVADGEPIGTLALGPKRTDIEMQASDYTFLDTVRPLLATTVQNALLVVRLEAQVEALAERERALAALNARFFGVHEEQRQALALDLHDDALQRVVLLARDLSDERALEPERLQTSVARWRESATDIGIALRAVCRDLRPPMLDDLGLGAALEWLATETRSKSDLEVVTQISDVGRVEPGLEISLYRVAQESLNNVRKHAHASTVVITLERDTEWLRLEVADNGKGIGRSLGVLNSGAAPSLGLLGMRERVAPWSGTIQVQPGPAGGTLVLAEVPVGPRSSSIDLLAA